jgi:transketolase
LVIRYSLDSLSKPNTRPLCIIANTIKGKGISFIENNPEWHHKFPNNEEYQTIINELTTTTNGQ